MSEPTTKPFIGSRISLMSLSQIRYEGVLNGVDQTEATVTLQDVQIFGTEGRVGHPSGNEIPPENKTYATIIFRATDILELQVIAVPDISSLLPQAEPDKSPCLRPSKLRQQPDSQKIVFMNLIMSAQSEIERKNIICERLYGLISSMDECPGKITGMFFKAMDDFELLALLNSATALKAKVDEARGLLEQQKVHNDLSDKERLKVMIGQRLCLLLVDAHKFVHLCIGCRNHQPTHLCEVPAQITKVLLATMDTTELLALLKDTSALKVKVEEIANKEIIKRQSRVARTKPLQTFDNLISLPKKDEHCIEVTSLDSATKPTPPQQSAVDIASDYTMSSTVQSDSSALILLESTSTTMMSIEQKLEQAELGVTPTAVDKHSAGKIGKKKANALKKKRQEKRDKKKRQEEKRKNNEVEAAAAAAAHEKLVEKQRVKATKEAAASATMKATAVAMEETVKAAVCNSADRDVGDSVVVFTDSKYVPDMDEKAAMKKAKQISLAAKREEQKLRTALMVTLQTEQATLTQQMKALQAEFQNTTKEANIRTNKLQAQLASLTQQNAVTEQTLKEQQHIYKQVLCYRQRSILQTELEALIAKHGMAECPSKITSMLLEAMETTELLPLLDDATALKRKVDEARVRAILLH